jgi:ubiquitin-like domain-containing CTD phosphatase 1
MMEDDKKYKLIAKHKGKQIPIELSSKSTVLDLKRKIAEICNILPKRQKLMGLCKTKITSDSTTLEELQVAPNATFLLVGTEESQVRQVRTEPKNLPHVIDDFDFIPQEDQVKMTTEIKQKLKKRLETVHVHLITKPREGKKLCVIDIDYTIFDCKTRTGNVMGKGCVF